MIDELMIGGIPLWYLGVILPTMLVLVLGGKVLKIKDLKNSHFTILMVVGYVITRFLSIFVLFVILDWGGKWDLTKVFYPQAQEVLKGNTIYIDFESSYSPFFPFLLSLPLLIIDKPISIVFLFLGFDLIVLFVGMRYVESFFEKEYVRIFIWQYIFNPLSWLFLTFWNQDEIVLAAFLILAFFLIRNQKEIEASLLLGIGFLVTKFLIVIFFLPLFLIFSRPIRALIVTTVVIIIGYIPFILMGANILLPITTQVGYNAVGANPWVILEAIGIRFLGIENLISLVVLGTIFCLFFISYHRSNYRILNLLKGKIVLLFEKIPKLDPEALVVLFLLIFMLSSKKSFSFYAQICFVFLILLYVHRMVLKKDNRISNKILSFSSLYYAYTFILSILYYASFYLTARGDESYPVLSAYWIVGILVVLTAILCEIFMISIILRNSNETPTSM